MSWSSWKIFQNALYKVLWLIQMEKKTLAVTCYLFYFNDLPVVERWTSPFFVQTFKCSYFWHPDPLIHVEKKSYVIGEDERVNYLMLSYLFILCIFTCLFSYFLCCINFRSEIDRTRSQVRSVDGAGFQGQASQCTNGVNELSSHRILSHLAVRYLKSLKVCRGMFDVASFYTTRFPLD